MARIDELKERLTTLRFWLGIVVATLLGIIGWSISNYSKINTFLFIGAIMIVFFLIIIVFLLNKAIDNKCKEIGKLDK